MPCHRLLALLVRALPLGRRRLVLETLFLRQKPADEVHGTPVLGGLHHVYRAAASAKRHRARARGTAQPLSSRGVMSPRTRRCPSLHGGGLSGACSLTEAGAYS